MSRKIASVALPLAAALAALTACSNGSTDDPGAITADESRQLNDAAAMLDANSVDLNAASADAASDTDPNAAPAAANDTETAP